MTSQPQRNWSVPGYSLRHLLTFTALLALGIAVLVAYREYDKLQRQEKALQSLSSHLEVTDESVLQAVSYPQVSNNFHTWDAYVPRHELFDLRFAVDNVSEAGMPTEFQGFPLGQGKHRITLQTDGGPNEDYRFIVYLDGKEVFNRVMDSDWMPNGWNTAHGIGLPRDLNEGDSVPLHLIGKIFTPRVDVPSSHYFNGQSDTWVTRPGYRLWIDRQNRSYDAPTPFIGFDNNDPGFRGIGMRDGLRYRAEGRNQYGWEFSRPASQAREAAFAIIPEFYSGKQLVLSEQTHQSAWWRSDNEISPEGAPFSKQGDNRDARSAFLRAEMSGVEAIKPVVEMRWDAQRPNDVALRLPQVSPNEKLTRWRLRIVGGEKQLWRIIRVGRDRIEIGEKMADGERELAASRFEIDIENARTETNRVEWHTDIDGPLQLLQQGKRNPNPYAGMELFQGLPLKFGAEFPASLTPSLFILGKRYQTTAPQTQIPGGAVIEEVQIECDVASDDWIWLRAAPM